MGLEGHLSGVPLREWPAPLHGLISELTTDFLVSSLIPPTFATCYKRRGHSDVPRLAARAEAAKECWNELTRLKIKQASDPFLVAWNTIDHEVTTLPGASRTAPLAAGKYTYIAYIAHGALPFIDNGPFILYPSLVASLEGDWWVASHPDIVEYYLALRRNNAATPSPQFLPVGSGSFKV